MEGLLYKVIIGFSGYSEKDTATKNGLAVKEEEFRRSFKHCRK